MRSWSYGINRAHGKASVDIVEAPWWLHFVEWFADWIAWGWLHKIPLPEWPKYRTTAYRDEVEITSLGREWGDVGCLVLYGITTPLINWAYRHPKWDERKLEIGYARSKELFGEEDADFFADHERDAA